LQEDFQSRGFNVLGFPCNQFGAQELGSNAQILQFAQSTYDVNFPMFAKIEVNGAGACPLYQYLTQAQPGSDGSTDIPWNFTKFLIDRQGHAIARFEPKTAPSYIADKLPEYL